MNPQNWTATNIAWLAGLLEGEGCFSRDSKSRGNGADSSSIQLVMSDHDVVRRAHEILGGGTVSGPYFPNGNEAWKPVLKLCVTHQYEVYAVLCAVYPWMGERRKAKIHESLILFLSRPRRNIKRKKESYDNRSESC